MSENAEVVNDLPSTQMDDESNTEYTAEIAINDRIFPTNRIEGTRIERKNQMQHSSRPLTNPSSEGEASFSTSSIGNESNEESVVSAADSNEAVYETIGDNQNLYSFHNPQNMQKSTGSTQRDHSARMSDTENASNEEVDKSDNKEAMVGHDDVEAIDLYGPLEPFQNSNNSINTAEEANIDLYGPLEPFENDPTHNHIILAAKTYESDSQDQISQRKPTEGRQSEPGAFHATYTNNEADRQAWLEQEETLGEDNFYEEVNEEEINYPSLESQQITPGVFHINERAEGERPAWTQQEYPFPNQLRNQSQGATPHETTYPQPRSVSRRLSSFFTRNNVITAEVEVVQTKKEFKKKWTLLALLLGILVMIAIGLGIGLQSNDEKQDRNNSFTEDRCEYASVGEISVVWKGCLCQENSTNILETHTNQYELIKTRLIDEIGLDLYHIHPCEVINIAMLWLADDMVASSVAYDDHRVVNRFALAVCFLSWYDPKEPWNNMEGWMTNEHECTWFGVGCNEQDDVISISLQNNKLSGSIPKEMTLLNQLAKIDTPVNTITGTLPTELGRLKYLVTLDVHKNEIGGSIPVEIGSCPMLKKLQLRRNALVTTIPNEIWKLTNLEILDLSLNQAVKGTLQSEIGSCTSLKQIHILIGQLSGMIPSEIGQLSNLQMLDFSNNRLAGSLPSTLANLSQLLVLLLYRNKMTRVLSPIFVNKTSLERITVNDNLLSGSIPTEIEFRWASTPKIIVRSLERY